MTETARWRDWLRRRPVLADALLALALLSVQLLSWAGTAGSATAASFPKTLALIAAEMACVVIRRRWTRVAVVGVAAVSGLALWVGPVGGGLGFIVIAYTAAAYLPLRAAVMATTGMWTPVLVMQALIAEAPADSQVPKLFLVAFNLLAALVCFFVGRLMRTRRAYVAALEERARTAEANQRTLAAQAVAEERRRIARELHDLVAHHIAVMGVLATGARRAGAREPAAAEAALVTIEETGRTVLREMRRLLHVLRADAEPAGELAPQPGLAAVEALVEQVREAGLPVRLQLGRVPEPLDPGVALTAFRIVQEALTNVLKHAGPATAAVRIGQRDAGGALIIEVFDTGRGPEPESEGGIGHGLVNMRERIAVYGGTLRTGARPGGGFRVYATIPADQLTTPDRPTRPDRPAPAERPAVPARSAVARLGPATAEPETR